MPYTYEDPLYYFPKTPQQELYDIMLRLEALEDHTMTNMFANAKASPAVHYPVVDEPKGQYEYYATDAYDPHYPQYVFPNTQYDNISYERAHQNVMFNSYANQSHDHVHTKEDNYGLEMLSAVAVEDGAIVNDHAMTTDKITTKANFPYESSVHETAAFGTTFDATHEVPYIPPNPRAPTIPSEADWQKSLLDLVEAHTIELIIKETKDRERTIQQRAKAEQRRTKRHIRRFLTMMHGAQYTRACIACMLAGKEHECSHRKSGERCARCAFREESCVGAIP
ncbi:hypothetical protein M231_05732 [Tremella mesenterica]|uniref:Uncharacterized protein n=1 Tax=Tremella mesenterica TaxID=5217 RepID=A0A4Q1BH96_TREME|nr:hypothetical protein M231_05732 [Tremella mesenterica]